MSKKNILEAKVRTTFLSHVFLFFEFTTRRRRRRRRKSGKANERFKKKKEAKLSVCVSETKMLRNVEK